MIQKIKIENFKVFEHIEIQDFSQMNVFVGENDSGKTSLLEAIFLSLAPSNPDLLLRTLHFRNFAISADNINSIFYNFNHNNPIKITTQDNNNISFGFQIEVSSEQSNQINLDQKKIGTDTSLKQMINGLRFKNKLEILSGINFLRNVKGAQEVEVFIHKNSPFKWGIFIPAENLIKGSLAFNIDNIRKNKSTQGFIEYLKIFNPHIVDIEVNGGSVYVNLENKPKLLDIQLMGTGFKKYAIILAAIFESFVIRKESDYLYICVDEIENGLYFKNCEKLLESLIILGREKNIQYFFSTHSLEFLEILRKVSDKMDFKECAIFQIQETKKGIKSYKYTLESSPYFEIEHLDPRD